MTADPGVYEYAMHKIEYPSLHCLSTGLKKLAETCINRLFFVCGMTLLRCWSRCQKQEVIEILHAFSVHTRMSELEKAIRDCSCNFQPIRVYL